MRQLDEDFNARRRHWKVQMEVFTEQFSFNVNRSKIYCMWLNILKVNYRVSLKKSVNKEISITFKQRATQRCVRSRIGGIFGCWALLNNCQEYRMCPSCVYTCLNIYNPCTIFIISKVMQISLFTLFFGTPCTYI